MKKLKLFMVVMLAVTMCLQFPAVAFAEDDRPEGVPAYAEKHTVVVEVPPAPVNASGNADASPNLWGRESPTLDPFVLVTVATFATNGANYAAFETRGEMIQGTSMGSYYTGFYANDSELRGITIAPNGDTAKCDNIEISDKYTYRIKVRNNNSNALIKVTVTYYTW